MNRVSRALWEPFVTEGYDNIISVANNEPCVACPLGALCDGKVMII